MYVSSFLVEKNFILKVYFFKMPSWHSTCFLYSHISSHQLSNNQLVNGMVDLVVEYNFRNYIFYFIFLRF